MLMRASGESYVDNHVREPVRLSSDKIVDFRSRRTLTTVLASAMLFRLILFYVQNRHPWPVLNQSPEK